MLKKEIMKVCLICRNKTCQARIERNIVNEIGETVPIPLTCIYLSKNGRYKNKYSDVPTQRYMCSYTGETFSENAFNPSKHYLHNKDIPIKELYLDYTQNGYRLKELAEKYKTTIPVVRKRLERGCVLNNTHNTHLSR